MRKEHCLSVLLIAGFLVTFVPSIHAGPLGSLASDQSGLHTPNQVASREKFVSLSGPGSGSNMLQFKAGGHLLGFQPKKVYLASLDHALSVEFLGTLGGDAEDGCRGTGDWQ